jgi:dolichyl-phosphate beta-glucosyltransferase
VRLRAFVVIPAYNEAARLPRLLDELAESLRQDAQTAALDVRFCIVDDGSRLEQFTAEQQLTRAAGLGDAVRLIRLEANRGKGGAIRAGLEMGLAEGFDYLGFFDADCAVPVQELHRALAYLVTAHRDAGVTGVVGSRVRMLGRKVQRNPLRHYLGRVFATFVSSWFSQDAYDTQCGLKIFERPCGDTCRSRTTSGGSGTRNSFCRCCTRGRRFTNCPLTGGRRATRKSPYCVTR